MTNAPRRVARIPRDAGAGSREQPVA